MKTLKALLHVDLQRDFFDGGALGTNGSIKIIPDLNELSYHAEVNPDEWIIVFSRDMHPEKTKHFDKWPAHCLKDTPGSEFHRDVLLPIQAIELHKGLSTEDDGYSPFDQNNVRILLPLGSNKYNYDQSLGLFLRNLGVQEVYIDGLVLPYCVTAAALGALGWGLKSYLIKDASVSLGSTDKEVAIQELQNAGVIITTANEVLNEFKPS